MNSFISFEDPAYNKYWPPASGVSSRTSIVLKLHMMHLAHHETSQKRALALRIIFSMYFATSLVACRAYMPAHTSL